jgi:transposase
VAPVTQFTLSRDSRAALEALARSHRGRADEARRARIILLLADGYSYSTIGERVDCTAQTIATWKARYQADGVAGLRGRHRGSKARVLTPQLEARILSWTRKPPTDGTTHWSTRRLGEQLNVPHTIVARAWKRAGLQPHRLERYLRSTDPNFEEKAAEIIGLYLDPPQHAAVFCVDEKTAIQALDRRDPILPLSPGRAERHGFEYVRHGTLSLYAALETQTGAVLGKTAARHTSDEFVSFLEQIVASQPREREIHIIADNLSAHKTAKVMAFLEAHPNVDLHYTPTYASWLNQVELWFGKIERELLARGIFRSLPDLARKIRRYITQYNKDPKPIRWIYADPSRRRITTDSAVTVH